jgi:hypothetical protein
MEEMFTPLASSSFERRHLGIESEQSPGPPDSETISVDWRPY